MATASSCSIESSWSTWAAFWALSLIGLISIGVWHIWPKGLKSREGPSRAWWMFSSNVDYLSSLRTGVLMLHDGESSLFVKSYSWIVPLGWMNNFFVGDSFERLSFPSLAEIVSSKYSVGSSFGFLSGLLWTYLCLNYFFLNLMLGVSDRAVSWHF